MSTNYKGVLQFLLSKVTNKCVSIPMYWLVLANHYLITVFVEQAVKKV